MRILFIQIIPTLSKIDIVYKNNNVQDIFQDTNLDSQHI